MRKPRHSIIARDSCDFLRHVKETDAVSAGKNKQAVTAAKANRSRTQTTPPIGQSEVGKEGNKHGLGEKRARKKTGLSSDGPDISQSRITRFHIHRGKNSLAHQPSLLNLISIQRLSPNSAGPDTVNWEHYYCCKGNKLWEHH